MTSTSRRRFLTIAALAAGSAAWPLRRAASAPPVVWTGVALGAAARLELHHPDPDHARRTIGLALNEVRRLEAVFSLYRDDSALSVLNRRGVLAAPPAELVALLAACGHVHRDSGGAFDPSVQPLWNLYAAHFAGSADPAGPSEAEIAAALDRVGFSRLQVGRDRIAFGRRGMALTLNGIAQGYVTDRVVDLLRAQGFDRSLVDMGETRALGPRPDGRPWRVGITDPDDPARIGDHVDIADQAVATSGAYGFRFEPSGRFHHLLDPRTGRPKALHGSVTVVMPTATEADAWSTAFSLMPADAIEHTLRGLGRGTVRLATSDGSRLTLGG